ncbi:hypothetical protein NM208_g13437 [Fusarium decemcellulare]|uniref:Uncharacterized protein n=1 Tax=Fusarium decemcellulare TaxID=57161 RepID=A0ACC1RL22_9HYPO|nr:hypothetical protein NM208_g13437 [Fusarium decemcellulare]
MHVLQWRSTCAATGYTKLFAELDLLPGISRAGEACGSEKQSKEIVEAISPAVLSEGTRVRSWLEYRSKPYRGNIGGPRRDLDVEDDCGVGILDLDSESRRELLTRATLPGMLACPAKAPCSVTGTYVCRAESDTTRCLRAGEVTKNSSWPFRKTGLSNERHWPGKIDAPIVAQEIMVSDLVAGRQRTPPLASVDMVAAQT